MLKNKYVIIVKYDHLKVLLFVSIKEIYVGKIYRN